MAQYSCAGKVFILGEYSVLQGQPALVAAVAPRFELSVLEGPSQDSDQGLGSIHPDSPAGRLITMAQHVDPQSFEGFQFQFKDPWNQSGGFGRSSAEFLLLFSWLSTRLKKERSDWKSVYSTYRELTAAPESFQSPSGADIVAQWRGGVTWFDPSASASGGPTAMEVYPLFDWNRILVFSATAKNTDRKTATHTHLKTRAPISEPSLQALVRATQQGILGVQEGNDRALASSMTETADVLWNLGLEDARAHEDRLALSTLPGVLAVKGCGANQSDAMIVLMDRPAAHATAVIEAALARGLVLASEGIPSEMGIWNA